MAKPRTKRAAKPRLAIAAAQEDVTRFLEECRQREGKAGYTRWLRERHGEMVGEPGKWSNHWLKIRTAYTLMMRGFEGSQVGIPEKLARNYQAAMAGEVSAFAPGMRALVECHSKETEMATKRGRKENSIVNTFLKILSRKTVPSDEDIAKEVKKAHSEWDPTDPIYHVKWYKSRFRGGHLPGQHEGRKYEINQPSAKKAAPKKAAKKKVTKKGAKKKSARRKTTKKGGRETTRRKA